MIYQISYNGCRYNITSSHLIFLINIESYFWLEIMIRKYQMIVFNEENEYNDILILLLNISQNVFYLII